MATKQKPYNPSPLFIVTFSVLLFFLGIVLGYKIGNTTVVTGQIIVQTIPIKVAPSPSPAAMQKLPATAPVMKK